MKQTVRTSRTAGYLEKIFRSLNADSFNGELEEPVITIQDTPTAYGHVTVSKAWSVKDEHQRELNIAAGTLQRPIEEVAATMLHEMVHLYNLQHEIQDCSRGGTYHNKKFRDEAQKHMLTIEHHEKYGWTVTKPTEELIDYIINKGWEDSFRRRTAEYIRITEILFGLSKQFLYGIIGILIAVTTLPRITGKLMGRVDIGFLVTPKGIAIVISGNRRRNGSEDTAEQVCYKIHD